MSLVRHLLMLPKTGPEVAVAKGVFRPTSCTLHGSRACRRPHMAGPRDDAASFSLPLCGERAESVPGTRDRVG